MPFTPQQNGDAECENRTLVKSTCLMIPAKNLRLKLWTEARILVCMYSTAVKNKTPIELWLGRETVTFNHFRECSCFKTKA